MAKTKTVYKHHGETLEPVKLATFSLNEDGTTTPTWYDQGFRNNINDFGIYVLGKGAVFPEDPEFWDAVSEVYANSSRIWVQ